MEKGLERLFWIIGGILIVPFIVQQSLVISRNASLETEIPRLRSLPVARPAIATTPALDTRTLPLDASVVRLDQSTLNEYRNAAQHRQTFRF